MEERNHTVTGVVNHTAGIENVLRRWREGDLGGKGGRVYILVANGGHRQLAGSHSPRRQRAEALSLYGELNEAFLLYGKSNEATALYRWSAGSLTIRRDEQTTWRVGGLSYYTARRTNYVAG